MFWSPGSCRALEHRTPAPRTHAQYILCPYTNPMLPFTYLSNAHLAVKLNCHLEANQTYSETIREQWYDHSVKWKECGSFLFG